MSKKEERQETTKNDKRQSELITKETFGAVCALFSVLALLILCTGDFIFGEIGFAVCALLTGIFGYMAYPILVGVGYLSVMSLIGKRLVKNRKAFACLTATLLFIALLVHTATTLTWNTDEYLSQCFALGENFPAVTVFGWLGGLIVFAVSSMTTGVGAIIIFAALTLFSGYLFYVCVKKGVAEKTTETQQNIPVATIQPVEIPLSTAQQPQAVQPTVQTATPIANVQPVESTPFTDSDMLSQRPAFTISDETAAADGQAKAPQRSAFSPFAIPNAGQASKTPAYEDPRAFLFSGTPAENYKKNLIFDPNANVNKRSSVETVTPKVPSYTEAYANSLNETPVQPQKIFADRVQETPTYVSEPVQENIEPLKPIDESPATIIQSIVEKPIEDEPTFARTVEEERTDREGDRGYQRHDYMNLFSANNPNVFGRDDNNRALADDVFGRDREEPVLSVESSLEDDTRGERSGLDIFDEEPDDSPYTLRLDDERTDNRFEDNEREASRFVGEDREPRFVEEDRGSRFVEEDRGARFIEEDRRAEPELPPVRQVVEPKIEPKPEPKPEPPKPRIIRPYVRMPLDDFDCRDVEPQQNPEEVEETKATILATLEDYKVTGASIASVTFGPTVTRYNVTIPRNIPPKKVVALDQPMAISLFTAGVNIYPNYEDGVVSIEVPNKERQFVQLGCMLSGDSYVNAKPSSIMFTMGKDAGNRKVYGDISKMIHLLVAGSSGSGKSVFLGSLIISLIHKYSPEELRLILIDPKKTEFVLYNNLPHLMINEIITDANKAIQSLNWAIGEMNRRYGLFEQMSRAGTYVVNLDQYNQHIEKNERLPKIVIIIDELADLMLAAKKDIEDRIQNLTQKARAAGIHLVVATQRPSTDVITGVIKSNLPTRIAFAVATDVDSRVILDQTGAQKLLGKGDFLYTMQGINTPVRVQSAFISSEDSQRVVNYIKANNEAYYDENATAFINNARGGSDGGAGGMGSGDEIEPVYIEALRYVILSNSASISLIQRKCSIGYNKAGKIVEWMEDMGYISSFEGAKARKVLISKEEFESKYGAI